jgi:iron complex outermembrane receptor protein
MFIKGVFLALGILLFYSVAAQDSLKTMELDEVVVISDPLEKYSAGSRVIVQKLEDSHSTLSGFLMQKTPIYLRELGGPGQVSSISFRGTGPGHTAVFWNGININSLTLGQTDFSLIPVTAADEISIMYGSGGALFGTDAIGGSIHLNTSSQWIDGIIAESTLNVASFGRRDVSLGVHIGNQSWQHSTRVYYGESKNDFSVTYRNSEYRQNNAGYEQLGLTHKTEFRIDDRRSVSFDLWYHQMDRKLQPRLGDLNNDDQLFDHSLRTILGYYFGNRDFNLNLGGGFVLDDQTYNENEEYGTRRWILNAELDKDIGSKIHIHSGVNLRQIFTQVDPYNEDINEFRTDVFLSASYVPLQSLEITANLRQTLVSGFSAPMTPSIGAEYKVLENDRQELALRSLISGNYKVPTFNDRFWEPGGNPDLNAESGWSWEVGMDHLRGDEHSELQSSLSYYEMSINDWILWIPQGSLWSPDNVRKVSIQGLEWTERLRWIIGQSNLTLGGQLAWVRSINEKGLQEQDGTKGKQLPYTPEWNFQTDLEFQRGPFRINANMRYTGERYTELSNTTPALDPFNIIDISLGYKWILSRTKADLQFSINNIADVDYQNFANRGMPGRNINLKLHLQLNKTEKDE